MDDTGQIALVVSVSIVALFSLVLSAAVCSWCFKGQKDEEELVEEDRISQESASRTKYRAVSSSDDDLTRKYKKSPAVTRKTIKECKFHCPTPFRPDNFGPGPCCQQPVFSYQIAEIGGEKLRIPNQGMGRVNSSSQNGMKLSYSTVNGAFDNRFERPDKRVVAEHVQPPVSSQSSLNDSYGLTKETYQTMGSTKVHPPILPGRGGERSLPVIRSDSRTDSQSEFDLLGAIGKTQSMPEDSSVWSGVRSMANKLWDDEDRDKPKSEDPVEGVDYKLGKIQFAVNYDFSTLTLSLKVLRASGLPAKDLSGTSDPYVKIMLLPDKKHKLLTKVKKKNLNPHWNECFLFEGWPHNKLLEKTLYLQVIDYDRFSRDDPMGETYIPLNMIDLSAQNAITWKYLQPCKDSRGKLGEVLLSLCYQPNVGRLTVIVMKCKDLKAKDINGYSDPYVKLWLMYGATKVEKKKTFIKQRTLNPVYNETFIYDIPWEKIREASLDVSVMDYDKVGRNELIGKVILGCRSGPMETRHWNDMVAKPRQQVAQWHLLKD